MLYPSIFIIFYFRLYPPGEFIVIFTGDLSGSQVFMLKILLSRLIPGYLLFKFLFDFYF